MAKSKQNSIDNEAVKMDAANDASVTAPQPSFSNGELGQLQEILFGQQQRTTNEQLVALQGQLTEQLESLSHSLNSRLNQLAESLDASNKGFEKQLVIMREDHETAVKTIGKNINTATTELQTTITALTQSNDADAKRFSKDLTHRESALRAELNTTKRELQSELHDAVSSLKTGTDADQQQLANLFSDISNKLSVKKTN